MNAEIAKTYIGVYVYTKINRHKSNVCKTELKNTRVAVFL